MRVPLKFLSPNATGPNHDAAMRKLFSCLEHPHYVIQTDYKAEPYCGLILCFVLWCLFVRAELGGVCFGSMDLRLMLSGCLDAATVRVGRVVKGTISY